MTNATSVTPAILTTARALMTVGILMTLGTLNTSCGPKYPSCAEDNDCREAEHCVNQTCQSCRLDEHCDQGQQCNGGACEAIPGYCANSGECGVNERCVATRCQTAPRSTAPAAVPMPSSVQDECALQDVYFEYDSSNLDPGARELVAQNARCMRERGYAYVQLTGHTDPRGTEEYNLALGDRRAQAVRSYLLNLGLDAAELGTSSMGEEMAQGESVDNFNGDRRVDVRPR